MKVRHIAGVLGIVVASGLAGCGTPYHVEKREEANDRFELVRAQMSYDQAEQAYETGRLEVALREIDMAITRYPKATEYHLLKGRILLEMHRMEQAMASLDEAVDLNPENHTAHYFRGIIYQRWTKHDKALEAYRTAHEQKDDYIQYLLASAETLLTLGRFDEARLLVQPKLAYFENNAALQQLLGQIAVLEKDHLIAAKHFEQARLLNPDDVLLAEDLARSQFASGKYVQAYHTIQQLKNEISVDDRPDILLLEARCLNMTSRTRDARNAYLHLTKLTPADETVWIELGQVAYEVKDFRRVALCSSRAIALAPYRFEGHILLGLYEQERGRMPEAIASFRTAAENAPNEAWPHMLLGMALESEGDRDGALRSYAAALKAAPDNDQARLLFANLDASAAGYMP